MPRIYVRVPFEERFWPKVDRRDPDECWLWTGSRDGHGYGRIQRGARGEGHIKAHRAAYELCVRPIPPGLTIDHLCRVPSCVNPKHLEPVTHAVNMQRSRPARAIHCKRGHAYALSVGKPGPTGRRLCYLCVQFRSKLRWRDQRRRELRSAA